MSEMVTLITTEALSPYNKGEVFTVTEKEADALLNPTMLNENGRTVKVDSKVEKYSASNKAHKEALDRQRGKVSDAEDVIDVDPVTVKQEARNELADKARPVAAERAAAGVPEQDQARVEEELKSKK